MMTAERKELLRKVDSLIRQRYFDPKFNGRNWPELVREHESRIVNASDDDAFEREMNALLGRLGTSHTHFLSPRTRVPSRSSINATFRAIETPAGARWVFQDVQPGGPADRAGIKPGDQLIAVNDNQIAPPVTPDFRMGTGAAVTVLHRNGTSREVRLNMATPNPKYSESPYAEPQSVGASVLRDRIGYLKVAMFPGVIGIDFAHDVDRAIEKLKGYDRLIVDLRGNPGGGIGGLRLMSYLTPDKLPVGYSLTRQRAENGYRREDLPRLEGIPDQKWRLPLIALKFIGRDLSIAVVTEGRGQQPFHGRVAVLVNEHTAGTGEMVAGFVRENRLGTIVGSKTAGRLLAGKGFKLGSDYVLMMPVGAYLSWSGHRYEGAGIEPDVQVDWRPEPDHGQDPQLDAAITAVR
jgi:C-terminal processing protease CtpA/Prc